MARRVASLLDFGKNQVLNFVIHNLAAAPESPVVGQKYYDTTTGCEYFWNGAWVPTDAQKRTGIPLANLATDPLARANHTGTQVASTISDFATAVRGVTLIPIGNLDTNPLARASHTGTQVASTISDLAAAVRGVTAFPIGNLTTDPLARANHTGSQFAATISDFNTAVRTNRLDQLAAPTAALSINSQRLTSVGAPTAGTDGVNRDYVTNLITGMVRTYAINVPSGSATPVITHNLNTKDVTVAVYEISTGDEVTCDISRTSVNTITLTFATAPSVDQYRVVVQG